VGKPIPEESTRKERLDPPGRKIKERAALSHGTWPLEDRVPMRNTSGEAQALEGANKKQSWVGRRCPKCWGKKKPQKKGPGGGITGKQNRHGGVGR